MMGTGESITANELTKGSVGLRSTYSFPTSFFHLALKQFRIFRSGNPVGLCGFFALEFSRLLPPPSRSDTERDHV
jgi:hypothetical protein